MKKLEKAAFAAGCFWGVEELFRRLKGVKNTLVGYAGGKFPNPTYKDVCGGKTGHAETVLVEYDPSQISYNELLKIFWENHDPTEVDRQGPDVGSQYRSIVFFYTPEQEKLARELKKEIEKSGKYAKPVATEIIKAGEFYPAEEYHQRYFEKTGRKVC